MLNLGRSRGSLGVLLGGIALMSAGLMGQDGSAPPPAPQSTAETPSGNTPAGVDNKTYEIGPRDILRIRVFQSPEFSDEVAVLPDGKFSMFLIGSVQASGLTPERLEAQLEQALTEYIQAPDVLVSVIEVRSKSYMVTGLGVGGSSTFPLVKPTTVWDAIVAAGGFREYADKKHVVIIRGKERITLDLDGYIKGKNQDGDTMIQNGDTIYVKD